MFKYGSNAASFLSRWTKLKRNLNLRLINTSAAKRGDSSTSQHHHHETKTNKSSGLLDWFIIKDHPKAHQGYLYRETGNLQGGTNATIGKIAVTLAWWWIFYHIITEPELIFGHMEYPDTSKWTDEELGIPSDESDD